jgi:threonine aldolase
VTLLHDPTLHSFASDNYSGVHPEVLEAIAEANRGHVGSYGADPYTARFQELVVEHFGAGSTVHPVLTGTGSNVGSLQALVPRWGAVICASTAHIYTDEGGAPERLGGLKLLSVPTPDGKLTPDLIDRQAYGWGDQQRPQPLAVSITQTTEMGTAYSVEEIRAITQHAHSLGMKVHLDGARIANAAATTGASLRELTRDAGVDVVSFGGTKNGLLLGESIVVLTEDELPGVTYIRKMDAQLASKMRFISAQFIPLLEGDLWLRSARHANAMATRLANELSELPGVVVTQEVQANAVFAILPKHLIETVRAEHRFYDWNRDTGDVRLMCSFDTQPQHVDALVASVRRELEAAA